MQPRRHARIIAIQALFEIDLVHHDAETVLAARIEESAPPEAGAAYARNLVLGTLLHRDRLDAIIQEIAPEWPVDQVACIDRNILRLAIYEILVVKIPPKVAINEAVDLAKLFGSDSSQRFVNGVLGTLIKDRGKYHIQAQA